MSKTSVPGKRPSKYSFKIKKQLILILPATNHPVIRVVLRLFFKTPGTFTLYTLPALTPKGYAIKIFNQKLFWLERDFEGSALVGISCATSNAKAAYALADRFRKSGSVVVMGGLHPSCFPEEALQHSDSVVVGEAESVWPQVVRDYEDKALKKTYRGTPLDDYFAPSFDYYFKMDPLIFYRTGILLSRGCKYRCEFCVPPFGKVRFIRHEQALALIRRVAEANRGLFGKPLIYFRDDNIFSDPNYAKKLFRALIPMKLRWQGNSSIDIAFDEEALQLAKESGCRELFIGFETIYPEKLQKTSVSHMRSTEDYRAAIKKIKSYKIKIIGSFIIGFDYYSHRDYLKLIWFLMRAGLYLVSVTTLTPFPGSRLYEQLTKEGRITTRDWSLYDGLQHVVFRPKQMSAFSLHLWFIVIRFVGYAVSPYFMLPMLIYFVSKYMGFYISNLLRYGSF